MKKIIKQKIDELEYLTIKLRKKIIENSNLNKIPHLGSCLSCIDILVVLYFNQLNISKEILNDEDRDRFILSKGHGAPALLQVLAEKEFFKKSDLDTFGENGSFFHEHPPKPGLIPGIEAATGSLGHGMPMGVGIALAAKIKKLDYKTYILLSDGECNEGTIWEAALFASSNKLDNLICIIDYNKWQATGRSNEIMALEDLSKKWEAFNWHTQRINGHNLHEIYKGIQAAKDFQSKPSVIIADTIKGSGISFMEDDNNWHYRIPNDEELSKAILELEDKNIGNKL